MELGENFNEFHRNIEKYYDCFDVSSETYLWLDNTGHGKNGAPYEMEDVLEDMKACEKAIDNFAKYVDEYQEYISNEVKEIIEETMVSIDEGELEIIKTDRGYMAYCYKKELEGANPIEGYDEPLFSNDTDLIVDIEVICDKLDVYYTLKKSV